MIRELVIKTGARLHFGLLGAGARGRGSAARRFGGAGMMIDRPGFVLRAAASRHDELIAPAAWRDRLGSLLAACRKNTARPFRLAGVRLEIEHAIPRHVGLGSGTQLGMALAAALSLLGGETGLQGEQLAMRSARGVRSAIGLHGIVHGGLLLEGGKSLDDEVSPLVARARVPEEWRVILARPREGRGISGKTEKGVFEKMPAMSQRDVDALCRIALLQLVPAAIEADFESFAQSLEEFGSKVGRYFAPYQGGVIGDPSMRRLAGMLKRLGIVGVGQTSWGPTLFIVRPSAASAESLVAELAATRFGAACEFTVAAPLNRGAFIEVL
jgi:beta-ribofuranosylaminobenzene 5'-phosphate synthase